MAGNPQPKSEEVYERNTRRAEIAGWLIVVGLGVELASLIWAGRPLSEVIPQAIADLLIAGGVAFELLFARKARIAGDSIQAEAKAETARANERAAILEKEAAEARERTAEIERLTAWRHISSEQRAQITDTMRQKAAILNVLIEHERGDAEAYSYSRELENIFKDAGVAPNKIEIGSNSFTGVVFTLLARVAPMIGRSFIDDAFKRAGIPIWLLQESDAAQILSDTIRAFNVYIFVGPKPPPPRAITNPTQTANTERE